jgi:hypothetical protein
MNEICEIYELYKLRRISLAQYTLTSIAILELESIDLGNLAELMQVPTTSLSRAIGALRENGEINIPTIRKGNRSNRTSNCMDKFGGV